MYASYDLVVFFSSIITFYMLSGHDRQEKNTDIFHLPDAVEFLFEYIQSPLDILQILATRENDLS